MYLGKALIGVFTFRRLNLELDIRTRESLMSRPHKHSPGAHDIRIVLVDDHDLFLAGLRSLIQNESGLTVVGQARNRFEAFEAAQTNPDVIVLDLILENEN